MHIEVKPARKMEEEGGIFATNDTSVGLSLHKTLPSLSLVPSLDAKPHNPIPLPALDAP